MKLPCIAVLLSLASCATNRWDGYDSSGYDVVMEPSDAETAKHIEFLEAWSADEGDPIPPGLSVELGYWLAKVGRNDEAQAAFEREIARYPYAQKYVAVLQGLIFEATGDETDEPGTPEAPDASGASGTEGASEADATPAPEEVDP
jgi:hypothetical protein